MPETVTRPHESAMLAAGWQPEHDDKGKVVNWRDPDAAWHQYEDWEAEAAYYAGDCRNVPRIRARVGADRQEAQ